MEKLYVIFYLLDNDLKYELGIPIEDVSEIIRLNNITPLPDATDSIEGIINLRNKIIPVINVRHLFNIPSNNFSEQSRIVVFQYDDLITGVIVDEVTEVLRLHEANIEHIPDIFDDETSNYLHGIGKINDRLILLLNVGSLVINREVCEESFV
ncbi:Positive regulator of CheA protein activity (CheW) [Candidatus Syntrophocurvum alkaliphilum]|uniref:Positive regulator of CheA protein activity (CheW) n=1 Tax=Candidatus Syntrophocurvum alkaliphilum TaxID=2293317 RepID=A0A6I6D9L0_9FIRM|nr:chemotaxis protein CheW [Candidatus Syntrophocurvum alkaliphilum]QGT99568.1 Positive regulator of CheA protein activity (CheW) [Candidatus Syntrophocurvum alkaliphilum]